MYYELALRFAALFISAKLMGLRLPFYSAALLAVAATYYIQGLMNSGDFGPIISEANGIRLGTAVVLFYFLDRNEGKRIRWLLTLLLTFAVLTFAIK
jgi:hypothetical protein